VVEITTTTTIFSKYFTVKDTAYRLVDSTTPFHEANLHIEDNDVYYGNGTTMTAIAVADAVISLTNGDLTDIYFKNKTAGNVAHVSVVATVDKQYIKGG